MEEYSEEPKHSRTWCIFDEVLLVVAQDVADISLALMEKDELMAWLAKLILCFENETDEGARRTIADEEWAAIKHRVAAYLHDTVEEMIERLL